MNGLVYDLVLIVTSILFGVGLCTRRHPTWYVGAYAALASVIFRSFRVATDRAGMEMPTHPLYLNDFTAAVTALAFMICSPASERVRVWGARALVFFSIAHVLPLHYLWESRALQTLGHLCVVVGAWCPNV